MRKMACASLWSRVREVILIVSRSAIDVPIFPFSPQPHLTGCIHKHMHYHLQATLGSPTCHILKSKSFFVTTAVCCFITADRHVAASVPPSPSSSSCLLLAILAVTTTSLYRQFLPPHLGMGSLCQVPALVLLSLPSFRFFSFLPFFVIQHHGTMHLIDDYGERQRSGPLC